MFGKRLQLLAVSEAKLLTANLLEQIKALGIFEIAPPLNDAEDAYRFTVSNRPDIVVAEMMEMGDCAAEFVTDLYNHSDWLPLTLVINHAGSRRFDQYLRTFRFSKYIDMKEPQNRSAEILDWLQSEANRLAEVEMTLPTKTIHPNNGRRRKISRWLETIGIKVDSVPHKYLIDAIVYEIDHPGSRAGQYTYDLIAHHYHVNGSAVERSVRNAIHMAWLNTNLHILERSYPNRDQVYAKAPTAGEFIAQGAVAYREGWMEQEHLESETAPEKTL